MPGLPNRACSRRTVAIREILRRNPISHATKRIRRSHRDPFCIAVAQKFRQNFLFRGRRQWPQAISSVPVLRSGLALEKYNKTVGFLLSGGRICIMGKNMHHGLASVFRIDLNTHRPLNVGLTRKVATAVPEREFLGPSANRLASNLQATPAKSS